MARYWVFLNDEVSGPFELEQLIRQRGFSRQTLVCIDDHSGKPTNWISPAGIPELAHIFKAVDEQMQKPVYTPPPKAKAAPKPVPRPIRAYTPAVTLKAPTRDSSSTWIWLLVAAAILGGAAYAWNQHARQGTQAKEQEAAQTLVETARLPAASLYSTLRQYIQEKGIQPKWDVERVEDALYHVSLSFYAPAAPAARPTLTDYAFESNTQAQTVRGLNTAAVKLLSEGFPAPQTDKPKAAPEPKKAPGESFDQAIDGRRAAVESGDFPAVWDSFSRRKKAEMAKGGISKDGYLRVQGLTHRVETALKQTVMKTKADSDTERLVLIKQTQPDRPDIFVKQQWVFENNVWKLDDEQKKSSAAAPAESAPAPAPASTPSSVAPATTAPVAPSAEKPVPATLPGMSN